MVSESMLASATLHHPVLGELRWHSLHHRWYGTVSGRRSNVGLAIRNRQTQKPGELAAIARHVQVIVEAEEDILRAATELLPNDFAGIDIEQFLLETRIASIECQWGGENEAGVWILGGEMLEYYDVLALVDEFATVTSAVVP